MQEREDLTNVRFLDYVPRSHLHMSLSMADVHLISMRPEMTGIVVPGKLYGVMAAGRPAVFVGPRALRDGRHDPARPAAASRSRRGDVDGLVAAITHLADDPSLARRMGERGRSAFLAAYERNLCCNHWRELLGELVQRSGVHVRPARRSRPDEPPSARPSRAVAARHRPDR